MEQFKKKKNERGQKSKRRRLNYEGVAGFQVNQGL
jgi:hypothetical protein